MRTIPNTNENADVGIIWQTEDVAKGTGPDRVVVCEHAQIPVITDVLKFHAAFPHFIVASANGSSLRVQAQAICRRMAKDEPAAQRAAILNAIRGLRNAAAVRTVEKIVIKRVAFVPTLNGDVVEIDLSNAPASIAALVDAGYDASTAQRIVAKMSNN